MNVVNFAEGILGIDQTAAPVVAKCLKQVSEENSDVVSATKMNIVAGCLEVGLRVNIKILREIGESWLAKTQKLFLSL